MNDIKSALEQLDHENEDHWTNSGLPNIDVVSGLVGHQVKRSEIGAAWTGFDRQAASEIAADKEPPAPPVPSGESDAGSEANGSSQDDNENKEVPQPNVTGQDLAELNAALVAEIKELNAMINSLEGEKAFPDPYGGDDNCPISLIERAYLASRSEAYSHNYELHSFIRQWETQQVPIKAAQERIDKRNARRDKRK